MNGTIDFPVVTSTAGITLFMTGSGKSPLAIPTSGSFGLQGYSTNNAANSARLAAVKQLLAMDNSNLFVGGASEITGTAIDLSGLVGRSSATKARRWSAERRFDQLDLAAAARRREADRARNTIGISRQIFFVSLGGFDTHN